MHLFDKGKLDPIGAVLQTYWTNLAKHGSPNGELDRPSGSYPRWPAYNETGQHMQLNDPPVVTTSWSGNSKCGFWDSLPEDYS